MPPSHAIVVIGTPFFSVTVTSAEPVVLPSLSVAIALSLCVPKESEPAASVNEYGEVVLLEVST